MRFFSASLLLSVAASSYSAPARSATDIGQCIFETHGNSIAYIEYRYRTKDGGWDTTKGSGFIIAGDGHILTNNHVVSPNVADLGRPVVQDKVVVRLGGLEQDEHTATIIRRDETSDLALLKIGSRTPPWPIVPIGDSSRHRPGDVLTGIGFPGGDLAIVPASPITAANAVVYGVNKPWWQTGLALNAGNSGGPIFDSVGTAVGIAVATRDGAQQITYAIPMQYALDLAKAGGATQLESAGPCATNAAGAGQLPPAKDERSRTGRNSSQTIVIRKQESHGDKSPNVGVNPGIINIQ